MTEKAIRLFNATVSPLVDAMLRHAGAATLIVIFVFPFFFPTSAYLWCIVCLCWYMVSLVVRAAFPSEKASSDIIRGARLQTDYHASPSLEEVAEIREELEEMPLPSPGKGKPFNWFGNYVPESDANKAFFAVGTPSSGKSLVLLMLLRSVLDNFPSKRARRLLVYDAKRDIVPLLASGGLTVGEDVLILHPFDDRGVSWDVAADVQRETEARELAAAIIHSTKNDSQPFFPNGAKLILSALFLSLRDRAPGNWTLRDVCCIVSNSSLLRYVFETSNIDLAHTANDQFLSQNKASDVYSQLLVDIGPLRAIAAGWHGKPGISMREWVRSEKILVLPSDDSMKEQLQRFARVFLSRLVPLLETHEEGHVTNHAVTPDYTWVFIDEFEEAGHIEVISPLIKKGRSFGICTAIAFQSLSGLEAVYGKDLAHSIIGSMGTSAVLRIGCQHTAEWAANHIGKSEKYQYTTNHTYSTNGSTTVSESIVQSHLLTPDEIKMLETVDVTDCLNGVAVYRSSGTHRVTLPMKAVKQMLPKTDGTTASFVSTASSEELSFTEDDAVRLHLPWPLPGRRASAPKEAPKKPKPRRPDVDIDVSVDNIPALPAKPPRPVPNISNIKRRHKRR